LWLVALPCITGHFPALVETVESIQSSPIGFIEVANKFALILFINLYTTESNARNNFSSNLHGGSDNLREVEVNDMPISKKTTSYGGLCFFVGYKDNLEKFNNVLKTFTP
jgi:hypothetical protein